MRVVPIRRPHRVSKRDWPSPSTQLSQFQFTSRLCSPRSRDLHSLSSPIVWKPAKRPIWLPLACHLLPTYSSLDLNLGGNMHPFHSMFLLSSGTINSIMPHQAAEAPNMARLAAVLVYCTVRGFATAAMKHQSSTLPASSPSLPA